VTPSITAPGDIKFGDATVKRRVRQKTSTHSFTMVFVPKPHSVPFSCFEADHECVTDRQTDRQTELSSCSIEQSHGNRTGTTELKFECHLYASDWDVAGGVTALVMRRRRSRSFFFADVHRHRLSNYHRTQPSSHEMD